MEFKHPKYYKELRKRNKLAESRQSVVGGQQQSDQAISKPDNLEVVDSVRPGPGQATSYKRQAASYKPQATSSKLQAFGGAASSKR